ncbi:MAG: hypothetical protein QXF04_03040 [Candidatus Aenigmatarchaeota archaeon]
MKTHIVVSFVVLLMTAVVSLQTFIELWYFISNSTIRITSAISVSAGEIISIELPEIRKYDRIYLVVDGRVNVDEINVTPVSVKQLPLRVETFEHDVFPTLIGEKRYMLIAYEDFEKAYLQLRLQPLTPFVIKNIEGIQRFRVLSECGSRMMCVELSPLRFNPNNNYTQIAFIYPYRQTIEPNFKISGVIELVRGRVDYIIIIVMTEKNWYAYKVVDPYSPPGTVVYYDIDAYSVDIYGRIGEFLGENLVAIAIGVGISKDLYEEYSSPIVGIGELRIQNGDFTLRVEPIILDSFTFNLEIYILRKFQPSRNYLVSIISLTVLFVSLALFTAKVARGGLD